MTKFFNNIFLRRKNAHFYKCLLFNMLYCFLDYFYVLKHIKRKQNASKTKQNATRFDFASKVI